LKQGEKYIGIASRVFKKHETNYSIVKKELTAIAWGMNHFNEYLLGNKFKLFTDSKSLTYVLNVYTNQVEKTTITLKVSFGSFKDLI